MWIIIILKGFPNKEHQMMDAASYKLCLLQVSALGKRARRRSARPLTIHLHIALLAMVMAALLLISVSSGNNHSILIQKISSFTPSNQFASPTNAKMTLMYIRRRQQPQSNSIILQTQRQMQPRIHPWPSLADLRNHLRRYAGHEERRSLG